MTATVDTTVQDARITEADEQIARLSDQLATAERTLAERRAALKRGDVAAGDVTAAQAERDVLTQAIEEVRAERAAADAERADVIAQAEAAVRRRKALAEIGELNRTAAAHAKAYADARERLISSVRDLHREMNRSWWAAGDALRKLEIMVQQQPFRVTLEEGKWLALAGDNGSLANRVDSDVPFANLINEVIVHAKHRRPQ